MVAPPRTHGDYNGDGVINAIDYTSWRDHFGSEIEVTADGDDNGIIDGDDYHVWRDGFVVPPGGAAGLAAANQVPEPATAGLVVLAAMFAAGAWGRHRQFLVTACVVAS